MREEPAWPVPQSEVLDRTDSALSCLPVSAITLGSEARRAGVREPALEPLGELLRRQCSMVAELLRSPGSLPGRM
jgi:hypothetical protein